MFKEQKVLCFLRAQSSSNESTKANFIVKNSFFDTVNATMQNYIFSAKKKFSILTKLMKNQTASSLPPLIENGEVLSFGSFTQMIS